jgi:hypothetical protein
MGDTGGFHIKSNTMARIALSTEKDETIFDEIFFSTHEYTSVTFKIKFAADNPSDSYMYTEL